MSVTSFVDTNILVYAEDRDAGEKHVKARDLILDLWNRGGGTISVQVLQEFFTTVTRKLRRPMPPEDAVVVIEQYLTWNVVENTGSLLLAGIQRATVTQVSFWDALIVEAAVRAGCDRLISEDLHHGMLHDGVRVVDPFV